MSIEVKINSAFVGLYYFKSIEAINNKTHTAEDSALACFIEAGFCDAEGRLLFKPEEKPKKLTGEAKLSQLLEREIVVRGTPYKIGFFIETVANCLPKWNFTFYLRGSYASYVLDPFFYLRNLIDQYEVLHPETKQLMENGWDLLLEKKEPLREPNDADFALLTEDPLTKDDQIEIKQWLDDLFPSLKAFPTEINSVVQISDHNIIAKHEGELKVDLLIGRPVTAPYLFTRDNRYIRLSDEWIPTDLCKKFDQSTVDFCLGLVRAEERHGLDFKGLLVAVQHLAKGLQWTQENHDFVSMIRRFVRDLPAKVIAYEIQTRIHNARLDPLTFTLNFLSLLDDSLADKREEIWRELCPSMKTLESSPPPSLGLLLKKWVLFNKLPFIHTEAKGPFAEWRLHCELLQKANPLTPLSDVALKEILSMLKENLLSKEETRLLFDMLQLHFQIHDMDYPLLLNALLNRGRFHLAMPFWLELYHKGNWRETMSKLASLTQKTRALRSYLYDTLDSIDDKEAVFFSAMKSQVFEVNDETAQCFNRHFSSYQGKQMTDWLERLEKACHHHFEWIADRWIEAYTAKSIDLESFRNKLAFWLTSQPNKYASPLFIKLLRSPFKEQLFVGKARIAATAYYAEATEEEILQEFLSRLQESAEAGLQFYQAHPAPLKPHLNEALEVGVPGKENPLGFLTGLQEISDKLFPLTLLALFQLPPEERLKRIKQLPSTRWLAISETEGLLEHAERNELLVHLLQKANSIFFLWKLLRQGVAVPEELSRRLTGEFEGLKTYPISTENARNELKGLLNHLQINEFFLLISKLKPGIVQPQNIEQFLKKTFWEKAAKGDGKAIAAFLRNAQFRKIVPIQGEELAHTLSSIRLDQENAQYLLEWLASPSAKKEPREILYTIQEALANAELSEEQKVRLAQPLLESVDLPPVCVQLLKSTLPAIPSKTNAERLQELFKEDGETLLTLYSSLHTLNLPLPKRAPVAFTAYLSGHITPELSREFCLALLAMEHTAELALPLLDLFLTIPEVEPFQQWLALCFHRLDLSKQKTVLERIKGRESEMLCLFQTLRNKASKYIIDEFLNQLDPRVLYSLDFKQLLDLSISDVTPFHAFLENNEAFPRFLTEFLLPLTSSHLKVQGLKPLLEAVVHKAIELGCTEPLLPHRELLVNQLNGTSALEEITRSAAMTWIEKGEGPIGWLMEHPVDQLTESDVHQAILRLAKTGLDLVANPQEKRLFFKLALRAAALPEYAPELLKLVSPKLLKASREAPLKFFEWICEIASHQDVSLKNRVTLLTYMILYASDDIAERAMEQIIKMLPDLVDLPIQYIETLVLNCARFPNIQRAPFMLLLGDILDKDSKRSSPRLEILTAYLQLLLHLEFPKAQDERKQLLVLMIQQSTQDEKIDLAQPLYLDAFCRMLAMDASDENEWLAKIVLLWIKSVSINRHLSHISTAAPYCLEILLHHLFLHATEANFTHLLNLIQTILLKTRDPKGATLQHLQGVFKLAVEKGATSPFFDGSDDQCSPLFIMTANLISPEDVYQFMLRCGSSIKLEKTKKIPAHKKLPIIEKALDATMARDCCLSLSPCGRILIEAIQEKSSWDFRYRLFRKFIPYLVKHAPSLEFTDAYLLPTLKVYEQKHPIAEVEQIKKLLNSEKLKKLQDPLQSP